jgi:capsular exopolysaccharide synthesis family protein
VSSDGKTLTAANVAATLAQARHARVLLIDADLRRPNVARTLGLAPRPGGLLHLLDSGGSDLGDHVQQVAGSTLDVLPCEGRRHATYEILTSPAFRAVVDRARQAYDTVIVDTPPVVPVPDSSLLGPLVDGYLVVVAAHVTPRKLLGETLTMLEPASVLGLVFNRDTRPFFGYYGSYYQSYFETAGGNRTGD